MTTYLVDTSLLIEHERGNRRVTDQLLRRVSDGNRLAICEPVAMELLAGATSGKSRVATRDIVDSLPSVPLGDWTDFRRAGYLYQQLRSAGTTVRSVMDCLIAICAMGAPDTVLLHADRDFEAIAALTDLRQMRIEVA